MRSLSYHSSVVKVRPQKAAKYITPRTLCQIQVLPLQNKVPGFVASFGKCCGSFCSRKIRVYHKPSGLSNPRFPLAVAASWRTPSWQLPHLQQQRDGSLPHPLGLVKSNIGCDLGTKRPADPSPQPAGHECDGCSVPNCATVKVPYCLPLYQKKRGVSSLSTSNAPILRVRKSIPSPRSF